jgi:4-hydroxybenzoate polyprenyltransferase
VVDDTGVLVKRMPQGISVKQVFPSGDGGMRAAIRALRPHQWAKNLLVFMPLFAAHRFADPSSVAGAFWAFAAFSLLASSAYVFNDLLDLGADRAHPRKRLRPLASGALGIPAGALLGAICLIAGALLATRLSMLFQVTLATYFALTLAYSLRLKRAPILDVLSLAGLYTLRIIAGGFAIEAPASSWILAFAMFLFFSLALVKRYAELVALEIEGARAAPGRGYAGHDAEVILALGTSSAMVSALVLALYVNGETAKDLYSRPELLWLLCPILLYWVSRIWLLAARGQMHDDPVLFAVRDGASYFMAVLGLIVLALAT